MQIEKWDLLRQQHENLLIYCFLGAPPWPPSQIKMSCSRMREEEEELSSCMACHMQINLDIILWQQVFADTLVKQASEDWINAVEYDGKTLLRFKQKRASVTTRSETEKAATSYPVTYGSAHSQKQLIEGPVNAEQSSPSNIREDGTGVASIGNQVAKGYATNSQGIAPSVAMERVYYPLNAAQWFLYPDTSFKKPQHASTATYPSAAKLWVPWTWSVHRTFRSQVSTLLMTGSGCRRTVEGSMTT